MFTKCDRVCTAVPVLHGVPRWASVNLDPAPPARPPDLSWNQPTKGAPLCPEARCLHLAGVLETASAALFDERRQVVNTLVSCIVLSCRRGW